MANDKQRQKKKKERERKNKEQVVRRRDNLHKEDQEINAFRKAQKAFKQKEKARVRMEQWAENFLKNLTPEVRAQVQENVKKLQAMEEEHSEEMKVKTTLNKMLESEGAATMDEKMTKLKELFDKKQQEELAMKEKSDLNVSEGFGPQT